MQKLIFTAFMVRCSRGEWCAVKILCFPSFQFGQFSRSECKKWKRFNRSNSTILCPPTPLIICQYHHIWQEIMGSLSSKEVVTSCSVTDLRCWFSSFANLWEEQGDTLDTLLSQDLELKSMLRFSRTYKAEGTQQNAHNFLHFLDAQASLAPTHVCLSVRWWYFCISIAAEHFCLTVVFDVNELFHQNSACVCA